ncbi:MULTISPECIES: sensor histidine kinase [Thermoanaerobacter]|uniref:histidine kinase n=2 Tax=Thermoanaerobacter TaxID=1754 RepID=B0KAP9_THEP3|nr:MULTISPECIES: HAMP domain-containing sensor histidine kinase [Thermoanaerobacter]ABY95183.1 integral membrane sensor signal transduction histidine kinase [Thermoanaerobacter pseudethanolicus ATCC 33223]ADV80132.1 ATP-binding region ATPase domain protein [Thermoanaerobacter brockii subsp. finnii Ako-1]HBW59459.1 sensor histidine kinase [Thermoanaerobacter sp.]
MKGIRKKLFISYLIIGLIILSMFWLTQVVFINKIYSYYKINQLKNYSEKIVEAINNNDEMLISELIDKSNAQVVAMTQNNIIIAGNNRGYGRGLGIPEVLLHPINTVKVVKYEHPFLHIEYLSIVRPFLYNGKPATLIMSIPIAAINDSVNLFKQVFWRIFVVTIAAILFVSIYMSKKFTRPIQILKNAAHQIASGNLDVKINYKEDDELGDLAKSMNTMVKQLSITDKFRKDLIANISHDLKTPLGLIRGYSEMLLDYYGDDKEKREKYLNTVIKETERMSKLVDDVLQLSKLQSGMVEIKEEPIDLEKLIFETLDIFEIQILEKNIEVKLNNLKLKVIADREMIKRAIINIISNAIASMENGGILTITAEPQDKEILIKVSDTGCGIPQKDLEHIFDRYYKGNKSGTGLGLAIVKEILTLHGSKYGIESQEGVGTTFYFTLKAG